MASKMEIAPDTYTENSALSHSTTANGRIDLYFKTVRGINNELLVSLLENAWKESPLDTLKIIFQARDCRGGKGEKLIFQQMMKWLAENHLEVALKNLVHVPFFGSWKDVLNLVSVTELTTPCLELMANQLKEDLEKVNQEKKEARISLACKWAPTERHKHDKATKAAKKIAALLFPNEKKKLVLYRKQYLAPLRTHLAITERFMCSNEWGAIPYSRVPSRCMNKCKEAFKKHDATRFEAFLNAVKEGKTTIKGKQMFPHELCKTYFHGAAVDDVLELQWKVIVDDVKSNGALSDSLVVSDVSGSMEGLPMEVSVALGLLISEIAAPPFQNLVITFHENPTFHTVVGSTLRDRVQNLRRAPWGGSTNFQGVFDLILAKAKAFKMPPEALPKRIFVLSDMQFNQANHGGKWDTNHRVIKAKYDAAGYPMPAIIYWNLRANTMDFPSTAETPGVALVSGFSPSLLTAFMKVRGEEFSPLLILLEILGAERYNVLSV
eukprot:TRINITY_DN135_c0_g1_i1.p1 TRINITY_DN135_c0_g1~~TRINITY_DN135_c0_g1_i1.p1  ORF type:complete len:494 (-),score=142.80 TRINITY_DN135_c0_g1_i1:308-1789(-)